MEEFAEITPFEPTIAPSKVLQCKLSGQINFSCQLELIATRSTSSENVIHGQMRRPEKRWKSAAGDNRALEGIFESNFCKSKIKILWKNSFFE
jgi:hypothetical protein